MLLLSDSIYIASLPFFVVSKLEYFELSLELISILYIFLNSFYTNVKGSEFY